jgi:hypothetical protein
MLNVEVQLAKHVKDRLLVTAVVKTGGVAARPPTVALAVFRLLAIAPHVALLFGILTNPFNHESQ